MKKKESSNSVHKFTSVNVAVAALHQALICGRSSVAVLARKKHRDKLKNVLNIISHTRISDLPTSQSARCNIAAS